MTAARSLLDPLLRTLEMAAAFDDRARLQGMLDFEAALARAEAECGIVPLEAAAAIAGACDAALYDVSALSAAIVPAGNTAIPLVEALTIEVARRDAGAARFVHWGATSQDAIDTGLVLQIRRAEPLLDSDLDGLERTLARLAKDHAETLMVGRTLLQHAVPITFGLKAAGWLSALMRARRRLADAIRAAQVLQFGGAAGTLASLSDRGLEVSAALARELGLAVPDLPWHGHRDRFCDLASALALVTGVLGKLGRDLSLMMQSEVGELREAEEGGEGRSSAMPQKRNPVGCSVALAAAVRVPPLAATLLAAMPQEHERALGGWQAEWEIIPEIFGLVAGAARAMRKTCDRLEIDAARMRENLEETRGLVMAEAAMVALAQKIGRPEARALIEAATRRARSEERSFGAVLRDEATITRWFDPGDLDRILDPERYLGHAADLVSRVLATRADRRS